MKRVQRAGYLVSTMDTDEAFIIQYLPDPLYMCIPSELPHQLLQLPR